MEILITSEPRNSDRMRLGNDNNSDEEISVNVNNLDNDKSS